MTSWNQALKPKSGGDVRIVDFGSVKGAQHEAKPERQA